MISSRDYVVRQIDQLVRALATILGKRDVWSAAEVERVVAGAVEATTQMDLARLRASPRDDVIALCARNGEFQSGLAVALAELLALGVDAESRIRALWLYEEAVRVGGTVPYDIADRLERLRD